MLILLTAFSGGVAYSADSDSSLKLIELFTSHGCSSCPPADRLLGKLLEEDDELMALEYHVDYWNSLVHGSDGSFTDPFSKAEYSMRQREYNVAELHGRPGVYTPQAVINGVSAAVGSNERNIRRALKKAVPSTVSISIDAADAEPGKLRVIITGDGQQRASLSGTDITVVKYIDAATTQITGGENRHRVLENRHIVVQSIRLGEIDQESLQTFFIDAPADGHGCVVMIQEGALTPVYAAAECP